MLFNIHHIQSVDSTEVNMWMIYSILLRKTSQICEFGEQYCDKFSAWAKKISQYTIHESI
jgi:hypothetical protein